MRTISKIIKAQRVNMGGIMLDQALPLRGIDMHDPFLLIHHWAEVLPGGKKQSELGVGPHPHRGFAPVSVIFDGSIHHRDSLGTQSIVGPGGTQWMNSGKGIIHSERPEKNLAANGGKFEFIQFWINAPATKKMDKPSYQPLTNQDTPKFNSKDGKITLGLIAGNYNNIKGKINAYSPVQIMRIEGSPGGKETIEVPKEFNALMYILSGTVRINGHKVSNKEMVVFKNDDDNIHLEIEKNTRALLLSGQPIGEPVSTYGPFVMNTQQEVRVAVQDYQKGLMGKLIEKFD